MIEIHDNFLEIDEIEKLYRICLVSDYKLAGRGRKYTDKDYQKRDWCWLSKIKNEDENINFFNSINLKISNKLKNEYEHISNSYINAFKYGDSSLSHTDSVSLTFEKSKTAIIYCNNEWDIDWGGETIFLNELKKDAEIIKSVIPKPGRLIIFDSSIPHAARVPNVLYPTYRYTLVSSFKRKTE